MNGKEKPVKEMLAEWEGGGEGGEGSAHVSRN